MEDSDCCPKIPPRRPGCTLTSHDELHRALPMHQNRVGHYLRNRICAGESGVSAAVPVFGQGLAELLLAGTHRDEHRREHMNHLFRAVTNLMRKVSQN